MNLLAVLIDWRGSGVFAGDLARAFRSLRIPIGEIETLLDPGFAMAAARFPATRREQGHRALRNDESLGVAVVGDARIDNRDEIGEELFGAAASQRSDCELLAAGWRRWGEGLANRLSGDFAFVLWDRRAREFYAARDRVGVRQLYYQLRGGAEVRIASAVDSLVEWNDGLPPLDQETIQDYLLQRWRSAGSTFFRSIRAVRPGHYLLGTRGDLREVRYWRAPDVIAGMSRSDCLVKYRSLLAASVEARLDSHSPVILHLSGGLDSSSIVMLADRLRREGGGRFPPFIACSKVFPGLACDESAFIAGTSAALSFPSETCDIRAESWQAVESPSRAMPGAVDHAVAPSLGGEAATARRTGARVVVSGAGGDETASSARVLRDLAAAHRWRELAAEVVRWPLVGWSGRGRLLLDSFVGLVPRSLRQGAATLVGRYAAPPDWLGGALTATWPGPPPDPMPDAPGSYGEAQRRIWNVFNHPALAHALAYRQTRLVSAGLEGRYPYLDARLVDFSIALPWQARLPAGLKRRLQREALADTLPSPIRARTGQTSFESLAVHRLRSQIPRAVAMLRGSRWETEPYVRRSAALSRLERFASDGESADWTTADLLYRILTLEGWLRGLTT